MTERVVLRGANPASLINLNQRQHWSEKAARTKHWRTAGWVMGTNSKLAGKIKAVGPVEVQVLFGTTRPNKRRDPHNFTPTVKALVDGLTDARLWPDDDAAHVRVVDSVFTDTVPAGSFWVRLTWEEA